RVRVRPAAVGPGGARRSAAAPRRRAGGTAPAAGARARPGGSRRARLGPARGGVSSARRPHAAAPHREVRAARCEHLSEELTRGGDALGPEALFEFTLDGGAVAAGGGHDVIAAPRHGYPADAAVP